MKNSLEERKKGIKIGEYKNIIRVERKRKKEVISKVRRRKR